MDFWDRFNSWMSMYGVEGEEETQDEPDSGGKFLYRKEKRLTTAITITHLLAYLRGESIDSYKDFLDQFNIKHDANILDRCRNYQSWLYKKFRKCSPKLDLRLDGVKATIERAYDLQYTFWTKQQSNYTITWWNDKFLKKILTFREVMTQIVNNLGATKYKTQEYNCKSLNCKFIAHEDLVVILEDGEPTIVIPWLALISCYESFLRLSDVMIFHLADPTRCSHDDIEDLKDLIQGIIGDIIENGADYYKNLKDWHPAVLSVILRSDIDLKNQLEESTLGKMIPSYLKDRLTNLPLAKCLREIDLAGMSKCFTIPIIDISASIAVCLEASIPRSNLKPDQDALSFIKLCITKEFYKKHCVWPPLTGGSKKVKAHQRENSWPGGQDGFKLKDFHSAEIGKILDFDYKIDTSLLLHDKSCCPGLSNWTAEFDRRYYRAKHSAPPPKLKNPQKRVILEYLDRVEVDCESIIHNFLNLRPQEMMIIILCWKEREMNERKGRGFTKLVFDPRVYQISCEGNMKALMQYFPYQTITKGGDALTKLLMNVSRSGYLRTLIDFKSWCSYWTNDVLKDYLKFLDGVFGLKGVYSELHKIAEEMLVVFSDRADIPKCKPDGSPELGYRAFRGFKSLGQGMAQSVWTVFSAASILARFYKMGIEAHITAAGDNQVVLVKETPNLSGRWLQRTVERVIQRSAKETGHQTKPEETFTSPCVTEFNKQTFIHGKKASHGTKKASHIGSD